MKTLADYMETWKPEKKENESERMPDFRDIYSDPTEARERRDLNRRSEPRCRRM